MESKVADDRVRSSATRIVTAQFNAALSGLKTLTSQEGDTGNAALKILRH